MKLEYSHELFDAMVAHLESCYPHEGCGIIAGVSRAEGKRVAIIRPATNLNNERAHDRYEMDMQEYLKLQDEVDGSTNEIIGFFHSHPDHPAAPSETDRVRAVEAYGYGYSYVIVAIHNGKLKLATSWVLNDDNDTFDEEEIVVS